MVHWRAPLPYDGDMYPVPTSLSPSRVDAFTSCPMAFRFASIERLPESPSPHTTKGSLVHRVLELLFTHGNAARTIDTARVCFEQAVEEYSHDPDLTLLHLDEAQLEAFVADAWSLVEAYFRMEDPTTIREIGIELRLEAQVGPLALRGIIDRLELDAEGGLVVTDYKTGRAPGLKYEQGRLAGVHFYSFLCEAVLGRRPSAIRLMYLRTGETITALPSAQSVRFITTRTNAVWKAVERACTTGTFLPRQGPLCASCSFQQWCPAFGGNPELAAVEAPLRHAALVA
ncbi:MAG: putative RecB family exonuclease [Ilumatobacteraceae bacterium]